MRSLARLLIVFLVYALFCMPGYREAAAQVPAYGACKGFWELEDTSVPPDGVPDTCRYRLNYFDNLYDDFLNDPSYIMPDGKQLDGRWYYDQAWALSSRNIYFLTSYPANVYTDPSILPPPPMGQWQRLAFDESKPGQEFWVIAINIDSDPTFRSLVSQMTLPSMTGAEFLAAITWGRENQGATCPPGCTPNEMLQVPAPTSIYLSLDAADESTCLAELTDDWTADPAAELCDVQRDPRAPGGPASSCPNTSISTTNLDTSCSGNIFSQPCYVFGRSNSILTVSIASYVICEIENKVTTISSVFYCTISNAMREPLTVAIILYFTLLGVSFALGMTQMHMRELFLHLFKVILVWLVCTNGEYGLGIVFNFYMGVLKEGIAIIASVPLGSTSTACGSLLATDPGCPVMTGKGLGGMMDMERLFQNIFSGDVGISNSDGNTVTLLVLALAMFFIPFAGFIVGLLVILTGVVTIIAFLRFVMAYLLAITVIAFMIALSPIFISLTLFNKVRALQDYFQTWLSVTGSHAVQPVLLLGGILLIEHMTTNIGAYIASVLHSVVGWYDVGSLCGNTDFWRDLGKRVAEWLTGLQLRMPQVCLNVFEAGNKLTPVFNPFLPSCESCHAKVFFQNLAQAAEDGTVYANRLEWGLANIPARCVQFYPSDPQYWATYKGGPGAIPMQIRGVVGFFTDAPTQIQGTADAGDISNMAQVEFIKDTIYTLISLLMMNMLALGFIDSISPIVAMMFFQYAERLGGMTPKENANPGEINRTLYTSYRATTLRLLQGNELKGGLSGFFMNPLRKRMEANARRKRRRGRP